MAASVHGAVPVQTERRRARVVVGAPRRVLRLDDQRAEQPVRMLPQGIGRRQRYRAELDGDIFGGAGVGASDLAAYHVACFCWPGGMVITGFLPTFTPLLCVTSKATSCGCTPTSREV